MNLTIHQSGCHHTHHLFIDPLCKKLTLLQKIMNIAFHIFTLGIPLAIIHTIHYFKRNKIQANSQSTILINLLKKEIQPSPLLGEVAIQYAKDLLKQYPNLSPRQFNKQPINQEIAYLATLFWTVAYKEFENSLKKHGSNAWNCQEVIHAADSLMKISYAISNLTLDDLKAFTDDLSSKGEKRTYAEALTRQDSYQYRTFYDCTNAYHWIRGAFEWRPLPWSPNREGLIPSNPIPDDHANAFYQEGTIQHSWNILYNNYCERIRLFVDEADLKKADQRHVNWTKPDLSVHDFKVQPDTQPT